MSDEAQLAFETGKQKLDEGKNKEALEAFFSATRLAPNISEYHAWYAQALNSNEQYENALHEGSIAIQQDPNSNLGFRQRGHAKRDLGDYAGAIEDYSQAIQIDPNDPHSYISRGFSYHKQKNLPMALEDMTKAISLDVENSDYYLFRSNVYSEMEDWKDYLLDRARSFDITGIGIYGIESITDSDMRVRINTINNKFHSSVYPILKTNKEKIIDYWPMLLVVWDRETRQQFVNGASFRMEHGFAGVGFTCLTNQNLRIFTLSELSKPLKKSWFGSLVGAFLPVPDRFEVSKVDQSWSIQNSDIQGVQVVTDSHFQTESIRVVTAAMTWFLYSHYKSNQDIILTALNMAKNDKFSNIWMSKEPENKIDQANVLGMLKELGELKNSGVITEQEFDAKKKELLSRL